MSRSRSFASLPGWRGAGALILAVTVVGLVRAQPPQPPGGFGRPPAVAQNVKVMSPAASQVFQRDVNGRAVIPIVLDESVKDTTVVDATVVAAEQNQGLITNRQLADRVSFFEGKLVGVPVGGPYSINLTLKKGGMVVTQTVGPVFVGDLWVLAGQSNMEGVGDLVDVTPPHPLVMSLGMNGKWARPRSRSTGWSTRPTPCTRETPATAPAARPSSIGPGQGRRAGATVRVALVERRACPSGWWLVPTAAPAWSSGTRPRRTRGAIASTGRSCARSSLPAARSRECSGIRARAMPTPKPAKVYHRVFADFIAAVRSDLNQPDLPFYYVQIGRFINAR